MSSEESRVPNPLIPKMKDTAILFGWISVLIIIAGLAWFFTKQPREDFLIKAINKVLEQSGDHRRLGEPIHELSLGMGSWFTVTEATKRRNTGSEPLSDGSRAYIFVFITEGSFFPCAAVVSPGGKVEEFIPLNSQGKRLIKQVSPGILQIYTSRIEGAES